MRNEFWTKAKLQKAWAHYAQIAMTVEYDCAPLGPEDGELVLLGRKGRKLGPASAVSSTRKSRRPPPVFEAAEVLADLDRAWASLPRKLGLVILANCREGYSLREIARRSGTPEGTVRRWKSEAMEKMWEFLRGERALPPVSCSYIYRGEER